MKSTPNIGIMHAYTLATPIAHKKVFDRHHSGLRAGISTASQHPTQQKKRAN